ncbi:type VII secretion system-associated protein [Streptomyces sp. NPDC002870]|uniref:type VII secretion system-associated protein n=1 Tax=Streptomyces sp. NPDC002870 TaxID=3364666 RepID=UPI00367D212A
MAKKTVLDTKWLKQFIDTELSDFRDVLGKMLEDGPTGKSVGFIADGNLTRDTLVSTKPLILGPMAGANAAANTSGEATGESPVVEGGSTTVDVGGAELNKSIQQLASAIHQKLTDHVELFEDIESALKETIEKMRENQKHSLDKISTDTFMDVFEDVESDLQSSSSTGDGVGGADSGSES